MERAKILRKSYSQCIAYYSIGIIYEYMTYFDVQRAKNACEVPLTSSELKSQL